MAPAKGSETTPIHPLDEPLLSFLSEGLQSCARNGMLHRLFQSISISRVSLLVRFFSFRLRVLSDVQM